jgi:hypothetical protein
MALFTMSHRDTEGIVARKICCSSFDGRLSRRVVGGLSLQTVGLHKNSFLIKQSKCLPSVAAKRCSNYDQNEVIGERKNKLGDKFPGQRETGSYSVVHRISRVWTVPATWALGVKITLLKFGDTRVSILLLPDILFPGIY